eukprot:270285-Pelagomonas_calceolata.AAC.2
MNLREAITQMKKHYINDWHCSPLTHTHTHTYGQCCLHYKDEAIAASSISDLPSICPYQRHQHRYTPTPLWMVYGKAVYEEAVYGKAERSCVWIGSSRTPSPPLLVVHGNCWTAVHGKGNSHAPRPTLKWYMGIAGQLYTGKAVAMLPPPPLGASWELLDSCMWEGSSWTPALFWVVYGNAGKAVHGTSSSHTRPPFWAVYGSAGYQKAGLGKGVHEKCSSRTHPPLWVVNGKAEVVHHSVVMVSPVRRDLAAHGKALQAQVKVGADRALDAWAAGDVLLAVVAVVQCPAHAWRAHVQVWLGQQSGV